MTSDVIYFPFSEVSLVQTAVTIALKTNLRPALEFRSAFWNFCPLASFFCAAVPSLVQEYSCGIVSTTSESVMNIVLDYSLSASAYSAPTKHKISHLNLSDAEQSSFFQDDNETIVKERWAFLNECFVAVDGSRSSRKLEANSWVEQKT